MKHNRKMNRGTSNDLSAHRVRVTKTNRSQARRSHTRSALLYGLSTIVGPDFEPFKLSLSSKITTKNSMR